MKLLKVLGFIKIRRWWLIFFIQNFGNISRNCCISILCLGLQMLNGPEVYTTNNKLLMQGPLVVARVEGIVSWPLSGAPAPCLI